MQLYELPFAKIIILRDDIAEVIINQGIEMDIQMVDEFHDFLLSHLKSPFSLLVNKRNSYTYTFDAQVNLCAIEEVNAISVVAYNDNSVISTENLALNIPRKVQYNLSIFSNREDAILWLLSEQEKLVEN